MVRISHRTSAGIMALAAATLSMPSIVHAQDAGAENPSAEIAADDNGGDIIVTAQKRAERLQDVPLAVTAVTSATLEARQINDTSALVQAAPSLTFQQGNHPANASFRIRGVGTALFGQGVESSVAVVVDGVVQARQAQSFSDLADIERIEVLRGPQGTLFGKNASAGVINVVTARPSRDFEGRVDATVAEHGEYRVRGSVSGPLTDTLRARLTGFYNDVRGTTYNVTLGRHVNGQESWGVRGKLEWDATDNLTLLFSGEHRRSDSNCCTYTSVQIVNPIVAQLEAPVVASPRNRQVSEDTPNLAKSKQSTYSLQADWDLGGATVTSITAYQDYYLNVNQPVDRINSDPVRFVPGGAYASWNHNENNIDLNQFSQELRVASNGGGDLTYVAGIFYSHLDILRPFQRRRALCASGVAGQPCAVPPTYQSSSGYSNLKNESVALFGQAEYRLFGELKAIGGLRVQRESGKNFGIQLGTLVAGDALIPGVPATGNTGTTKANDTAVTGKAGLQYEFSRNLQAYATYTRGYKGLGYNMEATTDFANQTVLEPEHVNAYEFGFKGRTVDNTLSFAVAAFRADYTNLQVQTNRSDPANGITRFVTTNAGSSRTQGVEVEATLRPAPGFSVEANFAYIDSTVNIDGLNCPLQFQAAAPILTGNYPVNSCFRARTTVNGTVVTSGPQQNLRNATLPISPKIRVGIVPRWEGALTNTLDGFIQVAVNFQSEQHFAIEQDPLLKQSAYALVDASIGVRTQDDRYSLTLFGKNLFNKNYYTTMAHNSLLATAASPLDLIATYNKDADRYFGATLGVRF